MYSSDKNYLFSWFLFLIFCLGLFFYYYNIYVKDKDTLERGQKFSVDITELKCKSLYQNRVYFIDDNQEIFLYVSESFCRKYEVGDSISLLCNKESGVYI